MFIVLLSHITPELCWHSVLFIWVRGLLRTNQNAPCMHMWPPPHEWTRSECGVVSAQTASGGAQDPGRSLFRWLIKRRADGVHHQKIKSQQRSFVEAAGSETSWKNIAHSQHSQHIYKDLCVCVCLAFLCVFVCFLCVKMTLWTTQPYTFADILPGAWTTDDWIRSV